MVVMSRGERPAEIERVSIPMAPGVESLNVAVAAGHVLSIGPVPADFTPGRTIDASGCIVMPGMVELGEDIFLKPVRRGLPIYGGALGDMVANPRSATVMGLLEEAKLARARGQKAAQQAGSVKSLFGRVREFIVGNF